MHQNLGVGPSGLAILWQPNPLKNILRGVEELREERGDGRQCWREHQGYSSELQDQYDSGCDVVFRPFGWKGTSSGDYSGGEDDAEEEEEDFFGGDEDDWDWEDDSGDGDMDAFDEDA